MSTLAKAPLIEVIFEIRWGNYVDQDDGSSLVKFSTEELNLLPGQLQNAFVYKDFGFLEVVNKGIEVPHVVNFRYRRKPDTWPCFQLGRGIFTINQVNDGYDWETYLDNVRVGLEVLDSIYKGGLAAIPLEYIELKYQDGFIFGKDERSSDFFSKKMNINYSPPADFIKLANVDENSVKHNLTFSSKTLDPPGNIINTVIDAHINGQPGLVMNTLVRSTHKDFVDVSIDNLFVWLNKAHDIHREAFKSLIEPTFFKALK